MPLLALMRQGVTPEKLALSLSLGTAIGLIPILGVSTAICALLAVLLRLNMPAIQLVNYLLTPLQLIPIHARIGAGNTFTRQSTPCRSLATPSVYAPAVALVRYHSLEPAQRHLTPRPGGTPR